MSGRAAAQARKQQLVRRIGEQRQLLLAPAAVQRVDTAAPLTTRLGQFVRLHPVFSACVMGGIVFWLGPRRMADIGRGALALYRYTGERRS